jgi:hypothetical protein
MSDGAESTESKADTISARLHEAHATLDVVYELTLGSDADERLESLGARQLGQIMHSTMLRLEEALAAVERL